jgi:hypothetical protein
MEPEVECESCGWQGYAGDLDEGGVCPDCGSSEIVDYEDEDEDDTDW